MMTTTKMKMNPTTTALIAGVALALSAGVAGCDKKKDDGAPATAAKAVVETQPLPAGDDKLATAIAKVATDCPYEEEDFDSDCEAIVAWEEMIEANNDLEDDAYDAAETLRLATLVAGLGDKDLAKRRVSAWLLVDDAATAGESNAFAARILDAWKTESDADVKLYLLDSVTSIRPSKTGLGGAIVEAFKSADEENRESLVRILGDDKCEECEAPLFQAASDPAQKSVRVSAIRAIKKGMDDARACGLFVDTLEENDYSAASASMGRLGEWGAVCAKQFDKAVGIVEKQAKEGSLHGAVLSAANHGFAKNEAADAKLKSRLVAAAKQSMTTTKQGVAKMSALELIGAFDGAASRGFIEGYAKDDFLDDTVKSVLDRLDGKNN